MALLCLFFINSITSLIFFYESVNRTNTPKQKVHVKVTVQREKSDIDLAKYLQKVQGEWINVTTTVSLHFETFYEVLEGQNI